MTLTHEIGHDGSAPATEKAFSAGIVQLTMQTKASRSPREDENHQTHDCRADGEETVGSELIDRASLRSARAMR